jgi:hypothetical protein
MNTLRHLLLSSYVSYLLTTKLLEKLKIITVKNFHFNYVLQKVSDRTETTNIKIIDELYTGRISFASTLKTI